jgi:hypothetical protein
MTLNGCWVRSAAGPILRLTLHPFFPTKLSNNLSRLWTLEYGTNNADGLFNLPAQQHKHKRTQPPFKAGIWSIGNYFRL